MLLKGFTLTHAIAITAHHDDAVLWCGGTILKTLKLGWKWTVVALCVPESKKQKYFDLYCNDLGVDCIQREFKDYQNGATFSINKEAEFLTAIQSEMSKLSFHYIFTHSLDQNGEYSRHANHEEVRIATTKLAPPEKLINFCYNPEFGYNGRATTARRDADFHVQLTYDEIIKKADWCQKAPDCSDSLKALGFPCPNPEGFRTKLRLPEPFISK